MRYLIVLFLMIIFSFLTVLDANRCYKKELKNVSVTNTNVESQITTVVLDSKY